MIVSARDSSWHSGIADLMHGAKNGILDCDWVRGLGFRICKFRV